MRAGTLLWTGTSPTTFLSTATDDGVVSVTAETVSTVDLTVASGTPQMRCLRTTRYDASSWMSATGAVRLKQGETARIGVIGTDLPTSIGELSELTISGDGVTLSDFGFSGATFSSSAPRIDWPFQGAVGIGFDVSVASDADLGGRALILRHSGYPDERQLVFGFIEIYDEGTTSAALGANDPIEGLIQDGQSEKTMLQVSVSAGPLESIRLRSWSITHTGLGDASMVNAVKIYADLNGNGTLDPGEDLVGSGTFSGNDVTILSAHTVEKDTTEHFLVNYDFDTLLTDASTFQAALTAATVTGVGSARAITASGMPISGNVQTVDLALDPDPPPLGDVTGNGTVDSGDAIVVLRYSVGQITLTDPQCRRGNVTGKSNDRDIDSGDAIKILRYSVGIIPSLD
jgi:hypothetical protein